MNIKHHQNKQFHKENSHKTNSNEKPVKTTSLDYRGMTLKEYFRISEGIPNYQPTEIKETDQENIRSSQQAATPSFNGNVNRQKIKTQIFQQHSFCDDRPIFISKQKPNNKHMLGIEGKTKYLKLKKQQIELLPKAIMSKKHKHNVNNNGKRISTLSSNYNNKEGLNRSTITSFYQLQSKKKKMLDKMKNEKQRINDLKLSDAFFITKYAEKFHLNKKNLT